MLVKRVPTFASCDARVVAFVTVPSRMPPEERLSSFWSNSNRVVAVLSAKSNATPLLPTFTYPAADPTALTLKPYFLANACPAAVALVAVLVTNTERAEAKT